MDSSVFLFLDKAGMIPEGVFISVFEAIVKSVSGVQVPLFEARMPWKAILMGMDYQLIVNLDAECERQNRYEGLQVGSVSAPNNNAGNWE